MLTDVVIANKSYTKLTVPAGSQTDQIALRVIRRDCPDFLLPIKVMEIDGELEIRYELLEGVRLSYFPKKMKKREFIDLFVRLLSPFKECSDWFLDYHNFLLDENYILVGKNGSGVKYVYLPAAEYASSDSAVRDFFTGLMLDMDITDDPAYMVGLLRICKNPDANLLTLLEYFKKESAEPRKEAAAVYDAPKPAEAARPVMVQAEERKLPEKEEAPAKTVKNLFSKKAETPKPPVTEAPPARPGTPPAQFGKNNETDRLAAGLFGDQEEPEKEKKKKQPKGGGLFGLFKGKQKEKEEPSAGIALPVSAAMQETVQAAKPQQAEQERVPYDVPSYTPPKDLELDDATEIQDDCEASSGGNVLVLRLESCTGCRCPEYIELDLGSGPITVGRLDKSGVPQADYNFDYAVSFVSRRHFRLEKAADGFRIIDVGSTNGTELNGNLLVMNMPYPLSKGDTVSIHLNRRGMTYRVS